MSFLCVTLKNCQIPCIQQKLPLASSITVSPWYATMYLFSLHPTLPPWSSGQYTSISSAFYPYNNCIRLAKAERHVEGGPPSKIPWLSGALKLGLPDPSPTLLSTAPSWSSSTMQSKQFSEDWSKS